MELEQWDNAAKHLKKHQHSFDPGVWHYNTGVVNVKLNQLALARYHFEMAKKAGFTGPEVESSLKSLKTELSLDYLDRSSGFIDSFNNVVFKLPTHFYLNISLLCLILVFWNLKKMNSLFTKISLIFLCFVPAILSYIYIQPKEVVVATAILKVHKGPSRIFEQVQEIPEGAKIILDTNYNGWKKVIYPQQLEGWIFSDRYNIIRDSL